ncbi:ATP-binding protein [Paenirhodobacter populi]|nr:ATP-binding protein [Sinirhodobacter populi]
MPGERRDSLARRIVLIGAAISVATGIGLGGASAVLDFRRNGEEAQRTTDRLLYAALPQLSHAYWQIDTAAVQAILDRLSEDPLISHLRIEDLLLPAEQLRQAGIGDLHASSDQDRPLSPPLRWLIPSGYIRDQRDLPLNAPREGHPIARLVADLSYASLYDAFGRQAAWIVASTVLQALLIASMLYLLVRGLIIRPLNTLGRTIRDQRSGNGSFPVERLAPLQPPVRTDEIGDLARNFALTVAEMERYRDHLQDEVDTRTSELVLARNDALAASRAKSAFLANMSHELRTPLNAITGLSDLLLGAELPPQAHRHVADMQSAARQLLGSIDNVLDLSKMEAGRMTLSPGPFALMSLVDDITIQTRALIGPHPVRFTIDVAPDVPDMLIADRQKLSQILLNLTSNAVKFTPRGQIRLRVRRQGGRLRLSVADSGSGIPRDRLEAVFDPFVQADSSTTRAVSGTGLGLAISRQMARAMGGDLRVRSLPGRGSGFTLEIALISAPDVPPMPLPRPVRQNLPARRAAQLGRMMDRLRMTQPDAGLRLVGEGPDIFLLSSVHAPLSLPCALTYAELAAAVRTATQGAPAAAAARPALEGRRIMIVEDRALNRSVLESLMQRAGARVQAAAAAGEALRLLADTGAPRPDVVITDLHMPELDGFGMLRALRDLDDLPVIASSADVSDETRTACRMAGFAAFLPKPISLESLLATLGAVIETAYPVLDEARLSQLCADDPAVRSSWLALLPGEIRRWHEMLDDLPDGIDSVVHTIRGGALQVAATDLARIAAERPASVERLRAALHRLADRLPAAMPPVPDLAPAGYDDCLAALDGHDMRGFDLALRLVLPPVIAQSLRHHAERLEFRAAAALLREAQGSSASI